MLCKAKGFNLSLAEHSSVDSEDQLVIVIVSEYESDSIVIVVNQSPKIYHCYYYY